MSHPIFHPISHLIRILFFTVLLGCASAQDTNMTSAHAAEPVSGGSQTVMLQVGQSLALPQDLSIQMIEFKDSRCPTGAHCVWAGHATVTLQVSRTGASADTIVIGTQAPPGMQLPYQAKSGHWQFTLVSLEPRPSTKGEVPAASVRASVLIEKI
jgi:hypothetical protein